MIGDRIKQRRLELGWTMEELAKKMGYSTKSTISLIESGKRDITQTKAVQFANVLGVSIAYLMEWDSPKAALDKSLMNNTNPLTLEKMDPHLVEMISNNQKFMKAINLWDKYESLPPQKQEELDRFLEFLRSQP